jgi:transposase-like protein
VKVVEKSKSRHHPAQFQPRAAPAWRRVPEDDAMADHTKSGIERKGQIGDPDRVEVGIRERVRSWIEAIVQQELAEVLGAGNSVRVGDARRGYRHGSRDRTLTTSVGPTTFALPRARLFTDAGGTTEWRSVTVARYQRRTRRVDEAILGVYLSGTNSRRIRSALAPLLQHGPLSKDAVSRLVGRLKDEFEQWRHRDLAVEQIRYLFLDGWYPKVRLGKRRVVVPVLVVLGVRADGRKVLLDLRLAGDESTAAWRDVIRGLVERQLGTPALAVIDGSAGLRAALRETWPSLPVQRCTTHKLRNLEAKAPKRQRDELLDDYRRMVYADTAKAAEHERQRFGRKWKLQCPAVLECLEEAGDELFTFLGFPRAQWKSLRTTNALERINEEFRRRTKTQASLPSQDAVLLLLFGLLRSGQITLRAIDGWHEMKAVKDAA